MFNALLLKQHRGKTTANIEKIDEKQLPAGNVTVAVDYSTLNYKDGLAITGTGKIIHHFPMVPGIDFAGQVIDSKDNRYHPGDKVILTGWGVGEKHWGGMAEKARVQGEWLVPMPQNFSTKKAMMVGTAGFTAMLCVQALIDHDITPQRGEIIVTGASGGVGSIAITLLAQLGYNVTAVTGRIGENGNLLTQLGAIHLIERQQFLDPNHPVKPLEKSRWAGAIDCVGGQTLAKILSQMRPEGAVAACGLAGSMDLPTTVMPFILRGVKLLGINSVDCPREKRISAWESIVALLPDHYYESACHEIGLHEVVPAAQQIVSGKITGRTIIRLK
ncbi:MAG: oxidoreductase [Gammaproteobacteria bacterium]|nr:MAG: oxidoreductase [Gammaproteobacteria bacterium]